MADMEWSGEESEAGLTSPRELEGRRPWAKRAGIGGVLALGLAGAALVACRGMGAQVTPRTSEALGQGLQQEDAVAETVPARTHCSPKNTDCSILKCCQTSGYKCFSKDASYATCRATCNPATDGSCIELNNAWAYKPANTTMGTSMYCFAVYAVDKGPDKSRPDYDLSLLRTQLRFGVGLFGCPKWEVFSDQETELSSSGSSVKFWASVIKDRDGEFHKFTRRDKPWKWVNTPLFYQVWLAIRYNSKHSGSQWVVKVDPSTVFMPNKLAAHLATVKVPSVGTYFENCKGVDSGLFGNLEVVSTDAFQGFLDKLEDCKLNLCWDGKPDCENWQYGPWGEDKFMQECLDRQSVPKVEDFQLTTSGTCPHDRPQGQKKNKDFVPACGAVQTPAVHPFRNPTAWFACLGTIVKKDFSQ